MFATSFGEHVFFTFVAAGVIVWLFFKAIIIVDDDGKLKEKAKEGIASWIEKLFK